MCACWCSATIRSLTLEVCSLTTHLTAQLTLPASLVYVCHLVLMLGVCHDRCVTCASSPQYCRFHMEHSHSYHWSTRSHEYSTVDGNDDEPIQVKSFFVSPNAVPSIVSSSAAAPKGYFLPVKNIRPQLQSTTPATTTGVREEKKKKPHPKWHGPRVPPLFTSSIPRVLNSLTSQLELFIPASAAQGNSNSSMSPHAPSFRYVPHSISHVINHV